MRQMRENIHGQILQEMINTPGDYYSLAYWLAAFIVTCTNEKRIRGEDQFVPSVYAGFSFPVFDLYLPVLSVFTC